jgi:hypothetical protein
VAAVRQSVQQRRRHPLALEDLPPLAQRRGVAGGGGVAPAPRGLPKVPRWHILPPQGR